MTGPAFLLGNVLTLNGLGNVTIVAKQQGNLNYNQASDQMQSFDVSKSNQTILGLNLIISKKPDDPPFDLPLYASSGLPISYTVIGSATAVNNRVTLNGSGFVTITGVQSGNSFYNEAPTVIKTFIVKFPQSISGFGALPSKTFIDVPFNLNASASSGLPILYTFTGPVFISGNTVSITGAGDVSVTATQNGNEAFLEANPVTQTFTVLKSNQSVSGITIETDPDFGNTILYLSSNSSSGLPVKYSVSGSAIVADDVVFVSGKGILTITASQIGNDNYNAAPPKVQRFVIPKLNQWVSAFNPIETKTYGDLPFALVAKASSNLPLEFSAEGPAIVLGNSVSITGAGLVTITANQIGSDSYYVTKPVSRIFYVNKSAQTIDFESIPSLTTGGTNTYPLVSNATSGLQVVYTLKTWPPSKVASVSGATLHLLGPGEVTITGFQAGNQDFEASDKVIQVFTIVKGIQTGIETESLVNSEWIRLFPNPSLGTVYLTVKVVLELVVVYDPRGVERMRLENVMPGNIYNFENLNSGLYLVHTPFGNLKLRVE